jgi:hypothetical protein
MVGEPFSAGFRIFLNKRKIKVQEKRIIKFCNRL